MITYVIREERIQKPLTVMCDVCRNVFEWDSLETDEFEFIRRVGGYNSIFGDGHNVEIDICQRCLKKLLGDYINEENLPSRTV